MFLTLEPHPAADLAAFATTWPQALGALQPAPWLDAFTEAGATDLPPFDDTVKVRVRDLLRHGGFKPAGRSKPCSEYLRGVAAKGAFPRINAAVDACNAAVLQGGLPISCIDLDRTTAPLRVAIAPAGAKYVFNRSGQEIDLSGLMCLFDAEGPCANAVKDAQRSKTDEATTRTVSVVWGTSALPGRTSAVTAWYTATVERLGGAVERLEIR